MRECRKRQRAYLNSGDAEDSVEDSDESVNFDLDAEGSGSETSFDSDDSEYCPTAASRGKRHNTRSKQSTVDYSRYCGDGSSNGGDSSSDSFDPYRGSGKRKSKKASVRKRRRNNSSELDFVDAADSSPSTPPRRHLHRQAKTGVVYTDAPSEEDEIQQENNASEQGSEAPEPERSDALQVETVFACKKRGGIDRFFCKFQGRSYRACEWLTEEEMADIGAERKMRNFLDREGLRLPLPISEETDDADVEDADYFDQMFLEVDRVIAHCHDEELGDLYYVKWKGLQYHESTWEPANTLDQDDINAFVARNTPPENFNPRPKPKATRLTDEFRARTAAITFKDGKQLRSYQVDGYTWLLFSWMNERGVILADEMGLGKTVQVVAFLNFLIQKFNRRGPYLVVAPLSTLTHWENEINSWTNANCVVFHGSQDSRDLIIKHEFYYGDYQLDEEPPNVFKFNVLLTTYEIAKKEIDRLRGCRFECLVVDEGHRVKNKNSELFQLLSSLRTDYRIIMTGTPVQNNVLELWTILHFLNPYWAENWPEKEFLDCFGDMRNTEQLTQLHEEIRPFLLRRVKEDVEKEIPPKSEILIRVRLTSVQKMNYRAILESNRQFLCQHAKGKGRMLAMSCIMMELRKVCNHPYLLPGAEERATQFLAREDHPEQLVKSAGKLILLDKLLTKLRQDGHKVLIFSQMTRMLDILEDYVQYRKFDYERLDGNVSGLKRRQAIDRFQDIRLDKFIFLLSTRAGGLGITLTRADTCIIYDSDWNPQNDLQAQARCHRIGQEKAVVVYRLITENTYEEKMFEVASKKLGLDQAVLAAGENEAPKFTTDEMDRLLRHGIYDLYKDAADKEVDDRVLIEENIDQILQRSTKLNSAEDIPSTSPMVSKMGLASFSTAVFEPSADAGAKIDMNDEDFWSKILPEAITAQSLKKRMDEWDQMKAPAVDMTVRQRYMLDLRNVVQQASAAIQAATWNPSKSVESFQELETLTLVLKQVQTHPLINDHDKKRASRWLKLLTKPQKRGRTPSAIMNQSCDSLGQLFESEVEEELNSAEKKHQKKASKKSKKAESTSEKGSSKHKHEHKHKHQEQQQEPKHPSRRTPLPGSSKRKDDRSHAEKEMKKQAKKETKMQNLDGEKERKSSKSSKEPKKEQKHTPSSSSCSSKRPRSPTPADSSEPAISSTSVWECPECTLINPPTAGFCDACNRRRPTETVLRAKQEAQDVDDESIEGKPNTKKKSAPNRGGGFTVVKGNPHPISSSRKARNEADEDTDEEVKILMKSEPAQQCKALKQEEGSRTAEEKIDLTETQETSEVDETQFDGGGAI